MNTQLNYKATLTNFFNSRATKNTSLFLALQSSFFISLFLSWAKQPCLLLGTGEPALTAFFDGLFGKLYSSDFLNFVSKKQEIVKNWLADLQHLAYNVDDILDEIATKALGRELTSLEEPQPIRNKVQKLIATRFSPKAFMLNIKMMSKIKRSMLESVIWRLEELNWNCETLMSWGQGPIE
ncbi:Uncharacterized protein TCM_032189 [Theobroma cacao]|uniref:Disease resistance N-terminal domain-containing protein n=1 Tax=Theobroma cacao TaxID=3641 RepID=A0A061F986_THECC|nr:Uncharacterized protein TCM_032189 [Theobroma cacao]